MIRRVMDEQNKQAEEKNHIELVTKASRIISRWSGPLASLISYGLILGLAATGLGVMALGTLIGMFLGSATLGGFGLLTGGIFLTTGCALMLWKLTPDH